MQSPYSNPYLSMRARGLFAYYQELGRVVSADELSAVMPEGRDAIQSAINELRRAKYIQTTREWNGTKWISVMNFTKEAKMSKVVKPGFSGLLCVCSTTATMTSDYVDNTILELLRSSNISRTSPSKENGGDEMGWNLDGEEEIESKSQMRRIKYMREAEADPGAVGKVEDRQAKLKAKYGVKESDPTKHRSHKPEELWSTKDVVAEFASLLGASSAGNVPLQINTQQFAIWINKMVSQGVTRQQMLEAVRMFFEDPRNLNEAGMGEPMWRRFIRYFQTVAGIVVNVEEPVSHVDENFLAHQEKMLKLLGGK